MCCASARPDAAKHTHTRGNNMRENVKIKLFYITFSVRVGGCVGVCVCVFTMRYGNENEIHSAKKKILIKCIYLRAHGSHHICRTRRKK